MVETGYARVLEPPSGSFFLFGPRGTGKSTWLRARFPEAPRVNLLDERRYQDYLRDPGRFADELRALAPGSLVVVDEVQRLPELLNEVHRFIEEAGLRFVLCGSSARKLKRAGTNLLAGRAVRRAMHPFLPEELGPDFDLDLALRVGTLPVIWTAPDREDALDAYARMYLREEIQAEALVRDLSGFARFLPIAAVLHGQTVNVSSLARDAGVARTTASGYVEVLEDTLLAFQLPAYEARLRVRERSHPKLYWVDAGLVRAVKRRRGPLAAEEEGPLFEGWVANLLRAARDYRRLFEDWWTWAPSGAKRTEVDFLVRSGDAFVAVEAKSARRPDQDHLRGLRAIRDLPGLARRVLVHRGDRAGRTDDGIDLLPALEFAAELSSGTLFPGGSGRGGDTDPASRPT